ncbi:MAG: alpha/beta hydrolase [Pseudomonadota bacterium]
MNTFLRGFGLVLVALVAAFFLFRTPDTDPTAMHAKYGGDEARYVEAAGMRIHYRVSGPQDAPVLVMIHGTAASLHTWEPMRAGLENRYRIIAYDQPGHGLTGKHPERDYTYPGMETGLAAVLNAEQVDQAVLIGNSMGGWVAWRAALDMPERVSALVLIDTAGQPYEEASASNLGFRLMTSPLGRWAMKHITPRAMIKASLLDTVSVETIVTEEMIDQYWELLRCPGNREAAGDQFSVQREDVSARLGEIDVPTLILWGDEDQLIPVSSAAFFEANINGSEVIIYKGVGHLPMEEVADEVIRDVGAFLETALAPEEINPAP